MSHVAPYYFNIKKVMSATI